MFETLQRLCPSSPPTDDESWGFYVSRNSYLHPAQNLKDLNVRVSRRSPVVTQIIPYKSLRPKLLDLCTSSDGDNY